MSDTFNMSGDFRGAIVNIKNTLNNTSQTIGAMPTEAGSNKDELKKLIEQLSQELAGVPAAIAPEAEKVAKRADELVKEVADKETDKEEVEHKSERLLKAAQNVAVAMPTVLNIAQQILSHLGKMLP